MPTVLWMTKPPTPPPPRPPPRSCPGHLVDELVEGVLSVCAGLPKVNLPALVRQHLAVDAHPLAVALHADLLDVRGELLQCLAVGQDGLGASTGEERRGEERRQEWG